MEILLWVIVVSLFLLSIAGVFVPVIPDTILLWIGFLLYHFTLAVPGTELSVAFWVGMIVLSMLLLGADLMANMFFVKKYGGSKWSSVGAMVGILLGIFFFPPIGMLVLPFAIVLGIEMGVQKHPAEKALKIALGTLIAFVSSATIKVVLQLIMITWFFVDVFWV